MPRIMVSGILTKEQAEKGYRVVEVNGLIELWWYGSFVAVFSVDDARYWVIREVADRHWVVR